MSKKILLIQPHSDDILLSAASILFSKKKKDEIIVLTVEKDEKRLEEDRMLFENLGIKLIYPLTKTISEGFHKEFFGNKLPFNEDECLKFCYDKLGASIIDLKQELNKTLKKYKKKQFKIVTCLGVGHPYHLLINNLTFKYSDLFYREFPHSYKRRNQEFFNDTLAKYYNPIFQYGKLSDKEHDLKKEYFHKFYKSQRSLLFYEKRFFDQKLVETFFIKK